MNPKSILPIVISVLFYQTNVPISEKSRVLTLCVEKFGRPIDEQKHLFEINRFYLLRVEFERTGRLKLLAVEPKYFFQESHPEWSEPEEFSFLSKDEFDKLLMVLDQIRSRGQLLESCPISLVTNLTAPRTDIYQHATVVRGELLDIRRAEDAPVEVRWLRIEFSRSKRVKSCPKILPAKSRSGLEPVLMTFAQFISFNRALAR